MSVLVVPVILQKVLRVVHEAEPVFRGSLYACLVYYNSILVHCNMMLIRK